MKHARLVKGLRMRELADRVGCSPSHISKIENDRLRPSLSMLHRLTDELGLNIAGLFTAAQGGIGPYVLVRAEELSAIRVRPLQQDCGIDIVRLIADAADALLEVHIHYVDPGAGSDGTIVHQGEELGFILDGELEMSVAGETFIARAGDCFYYRATLEHGYRNPGDTIAKVLWVCTPPTS